MLLKTRKIFRITTNKTIKKYKKLSVRIKKQTKKRNMKRLKLRASSRRTHIILAVLKKRLFRRSYKRRAFLRKKFASKRYKGTIKYFVNRMRKNFPASRSAKLHIKLRRRNTFLTCISRRKKTILTLSIGTLKYDGRKKSLPFAREQLARKFIRKLLLKRYQLLDIYLASKKGRLYRYITLAFITSRIIIRMIKIKKVHSHGSVRPKKARRT